MNIFTFTGNLGKDAEIKTTQSGTSLMSFSVAVKSGYGDNAKTNWINCAMFGKRTEGQLINYLKKGTQVAISGEYELKEWQSQDGTQNKMPSVRINELDLIGGKSDSAPQQQQAPQQQAPQAGAHFKQPNPNTPVSNANQQPATANGGGFGQAQQQQAPRQQQAPAGGQGFDDFDDDIPFS
jgi:single-strand DNA-binding protein